MMTAELETQRLFLRPLQLVDAEQTQLLFPHWEIVKFLTSKVPWPYPPGRAIESYRDRILPAIERGEEWHWTLRLKESPEQHIGVISLHRDEWDNRGYWLGVPWHGRGLMTEAVSVVNDYWFDVLGFRVLRAPKAVANLASRRISEKTGMRVIATQERDKRAVLQRIGRLSISWRLSVAKLYCVTLGHGDRFTQRPLPVGRLLSIAVVHLPIILSAGTGIVHSAEPSPGCVCLDVDH